MIDHLRRRPPGSVDTRDMRYRLVFVLAVLLGSPPAFAVGESVDGFPNWAERVMHQLANRARVDPQLEMTACGANCGEAA